MDDYIYVIFFVVYFIWAFYSGWKYWSRKGGWLNEKGAVNIIAKIIASALFGIVYGIFYLFKLILKFVATVFIHSDKF
ncbi:MAG TPA: hypothetical protein DDY98_00945 [Ruminococcaceae bacterium]|nr:hypothetical protein [Oscillospiraceae bacterium]